MMLTSFVFGFTVFTLLMLLPAFIAFKRNLEFKWVILIMAFIPSYGVGWIAALLWAVWP